MKPFLAFLTLTMMTVSAQAVLADEPKPKPHRGSGWLEVTQSWKPAPGTIGKPPKRTGGVGGTRLSLSETPLEVIDAEMVSKKGKLIKLSKNSRYTFQELKSKFLRGNDKAKILVGVYTFLTEKKAAYVLRGKYDYNFLEKDLPGVFIHRDFYLMSEADIKELSTQPR